LIARKTFDVALRRELLHAFALEHEMNMRAAAGIGHVFDGAEVVFAARSGEKPAESLEILIALVLVGRAAVKISPVRVHLPDFDEHVAQRFSVAIQYSTGEVSYFTDCR